MNCIVITGSTRGIGFGLALAFLKLNRKVIINGTSPESVKKAIHKLSDYNHSVYGFIGKVQEPNFAFDLFSFAVEKFKTVDLWVNNAGVNQPLVKAWDLEYEEINTLISINLNAVIRNTNQVFIEMKKQGHGKIFNMEGLGSDGRMVDKTALYGTSKRALSYFTKAVSNEAKEYAIIIGITSPGMVITDFITEPIKNQSPDESKKAMRIFNMLGSKVEEVCPFLVNGMLKTQKSYPRIEYLTTSRIIKKLIRYLFNRQNHFN